MKKFKIVLTLTIIVMCVIMQQCAYATGSIIQIYGNEETQIGETRQLTVKLSSTDTIGIVSGKITCNENVQIVSVSGKNNWNLTYNSGTGVFNIYKANGAKEDEIMTIEYKAVNENTTGGITISNLNVTSIDYVGETLPNAEKYIQIKGAEQPQGENQQEFLEEIIENGGNDINREGEAGNYEDLSLEASNDVNSKQSANSKKTTVSNKTLPKTGLLFNGIICSSICLAVAMAVIFYNKYRRYRNV